MWPKLKNWVAKLAGEWKSCNAMHTFLSVQILFGATARTSIVSSVVYVLLFKSCQRDVGPQFKIYFSQECLRVVSNINSVWEKSDLKKSLPRHAFSLLPFFLFLLTSSHRFLPHTFHSHSSMFSHVLSIFRQTLHITF